MTASAADGSVRLDAALRSRFPHLSRRDIRLAIASGMVRVNGRRARKGDRVRASDDIAVGELLETPPPPRGMPVPLLHADAALIVIDKPPCLPTAARRLSDQPSVAGFLLHRFPDLAAVGHGSLEAGLVHRLDTGTSGVLLVARSPQAWATLRAQFRHRTIEKEYVALVAGRLRGARELVHDLTHDRRLAGRMTVARNDSGRQERPARRRWPARALVTPLAEGAKTTLVHVRLCTGVTHQIRVQLAAIGHPVVGDTPYGGPLFPDLPARRTLLHAASVAIDHPLHGERCRFSSPIPRDFADVLSHSGIGTYPSPKVE
jgi:23S rRNA pseudouridine1911/1915/1917 synthase